MYLDRGGGVAGGDFESPESHTGIRVNVVVISDPWTPSRAAPEWLKVVDDQLNAVHRLRDGWDGETARRVTPAAVRTVIELLGDTMALDTAAPAIVPTKDGGLQLEWRRDGVELDVYVGPDGTASAWCREGIREWEDAVLSAARLAKELSRLAVRSQA